MAGWQPKSLQGVRVLILEDEYFIADELAHALRAAGGDPVGPVATVAQAEECLARGEVDAAIMDINLRGAMAYDFVERVAATGMPCLIVSGYGEDALPDSLSNVPRLEKPINASAVMRSLVTELERAG